jgi:hypothetical protein
MKKIFIIAFLFFFVSLTIPSLACEPLWSCNKSDYSFYYEYLGVTGMGKGKGKKRK